MISHYRSITVLLLSTLALQLTLTIMGETGETFAPGIAHLATGVSEMHEDKLTGKGVRIGIIDTGVDYRHPALGGDNPATRRVKFGHNFVDNEIINGKLQPPEDPMDCAGHGTMVAGIIGAITNTYTGVAPDAILGAYKVFGCKPGPTVIKLIVDAIDTAYRHGMDIVNMSFGLEPKEVELLVQAMQEYSRLDMIFIAAVPNYKKGDITGWNADLPGILPSTISVGGMDVPYEVLNSFYLYYGEYQEEPTYKLACGSKRPYSGMFSGIVAKSAGSRRLCDVPDNARGNIWSNCNHYVWFTKSPIHMHDTGNQNRFRCHVNNATIKRGAKAN
ncbi:peptidase S8/S53 domain-containing protein [Syncephalis plumigaleata]|nr:peptidase S8/S53 domain-containing protein [Syncephalis plumigaleata]